MYINTTNVQQIKSTYDFPPLFLYLTCSCSKHGVQQACWDGRKREKHDTNSPLSSSLLTPIFALFLLLPLFVYPPHHQCNRLQEAGKILILPLPATPNLPHFAGQLAIFCPVSVLVSVSLFSSEVMLFNKGSPVIHYSCVCLYVRKRRRTHAKKLTSVHPFHFPFSPLFYSDKKRGGRKSRWRKREYVAKRGKGRKELAKFKLILVTCISRGTNRELPPKVTREKACSNCREYEIQQFFLFKAKYFVWRKIIYFRKWQMKTRRAVIGDFHDKMLKLLTPNNTACFRYAYMSYLFFSCGDAEKEPFYSYPL